MYLFLCLSFFPYFVFSFLNPKFPFPPSLLRIPNPNSPTAPPHCTIVPLHRTAPSYRTSSPSLSTATTLVAPSQFPQTLAGLRTRLKEGSLSLLDFISLRSEITYSVEVETKEKPLQKSKWIKEVVPGSEKYVQIEAPRIEVSHGLRGGSMP